MKHLLKISTCLILVLVLMSSCVKNNPEDCVCPSIYEPVFDKDGNQYNNACLAECAGVEYFENSPETLSTIWFNRAIPSGGCKWFIRIKDKDYRMSNLDKELYLDNLQVWVSYKEELNPPDFACDQEFDYIEIVTIRIEE